ncbi:MAG: hypothetical protein HRT89_25340, partial [Lentisphaeria bacterium]|nr:hypothetical protein [Lentisphaeria bacterium]NQZ71384.1 hypothetical protein [Lentisphaeria bacterium]
MQLKLAFIKLIAFTVLFISAAAIFDYFVDISLNMRYLLSAFTYGSIICYAYFRCFRPALRKLRLEDIAWMIEHIHPDLNEKIISSVEFEKLAKNPAISSEMIKEILSEADVDISEINPSLAFPLDLKKYTPAIALVVIFVIAMLIPSLQFNHLVSRVAIPMDKDANFSSYRLEFNPGQLTQAVEGDSVDFIVTSTKTDIDPPSFLIKNESGHISRYAMYGSGDGSFTYRLKLSKSFEFWAKSGTSTTEKINFAVTQRPKIELFEVRYIAPEYCGRGTRVVKSSNGDLKALIQSKIILKIHLSKALSTAEIQIKERIIPMTLSADALSASCEFTLEENGFYELRLKDINKLGNLQGLNFNITAEKDLFPSVKILSPKHNLFINENDEIKLKWISTDDFSVVKQSLIIQSSQGKKTIVELSPDQSEGTILVSAMKLQAGDELKISLLVYDAVGQSNKSRVISASLISGSNLSKAHGYLGQILKIKKRNDRIKKSIVRIEDYEIKGIQKGAIDSAHQMNQIKHQVRFLRNEYGKNIEATRLLEKDTFFDMAAMAAAQLIHHQRYAQVYYLTKLPDQDIVEILQANFKQYDAIIENLEMKTRAMMINYFAGHAIMQINKKKSTSMQLNFISNQLYQQCKYYDDSFLKKLSENKFKTAEDKQSFLKICTKLKKKADKTLKEKKIFKKAFKKLDNKSLKFTREFKNTVKKLELYKSDLDWNLIRANVQSYQVNKNLRADAFADYGLISSIMTLAITEKSMDHLAVISKYIGDFEYYLDHLPLEGQLITFNKLIGEANIKLNQVINSDMNERTRLHVLYLIKEFISDVERLQVYPIATVELNKKPSQIIHHNLTVLKNHLQISWNQLNAKQYTCQGGHGQGLAHSHGTLTSFIKARTQMKEVLKAYHTFTKDIKRKRNLARKAFQKLLDPQSKELDDALVELDRIIANINKAKPQDREQLQKLADKVDALAQRLEDEAMLELEDPDGDVAAAKQKLALAASIRAMKEKRLDAAIERFAAVENDLLKEQLNDKRDPANGKQWRGEELLEVKGELVDASVELEDSKNLLELEERADKGELSLEEKLIFQRKIDALAKKELGEEFVERLISLEEIRDKKKQLSDLSDDAENMRGNDQVEAKIIKRQSEILQVDLLKQLSPEALKAMSSLANKQLKKTKDKLDDLLGETRELKRDNKSLSKKEKRKAAELMSGKIAEFKSELDRLEGFKNLINEDDKSKLPSAYKAPLDIAVNQIKLNQDPTLNMNKAIVELKKLDDELEDYSEKIEPGDIIPKDDLAKNEDAQQKLLQLDLDQLKHKIAQSKIANEKAEELEKEINEKENNAQLVIDQIEQEDIKDNIPETTLTNHKKDFSKKTLAQKKQILNLLANQVKKPELKKKIQEQSKKLSAMVSADQKKKQLQKRVGQKAQESKVVLKKLDNKIDKVTDQELKSFAKETSEHLRDNIELKDFEAAEKNLKAMQDSINKMNPKEEEKEPDLENAITKALAKDKLEEMSLYGKRALQKELAAASKDSSYNTESIKEALEGDFEKAAELTEDEEAKDDYLKAAKLDEITKDGVESSDKFSDPRKELSDVQEEALELRAKNSPEEYLENLQKTIEVAKKKAEFIAKHANQDAKIEDLRKAIDNVEAARSKMGEDEHEVYQESKNFEIGKNKENREIAKKLAETLDEYQDEVEEMQEEREHDKLIADKAETIEDKLAEVKEKEYKLKADDTEANKKELATAKKELEESIEDVKEALDGESSLADKKLDEMKENLEAGKTDELADTLEDFQEDLEPADLVPEKQAMSEEAFDAAAISEALENEDALNKAEQGNYKKAAESMQEQAKELDGEQKEIAEEAAELYEKAHKEKVDDLSDEVKEVLAKIEKAKEGADEETIEKLEEVEEALVNEDLKKAEKLLDDNSIPDDMLDGWEIDGDEVAKVEPKKDEDKELLEKIEEMQFLEDDAVVKAELEKAKEALLDNDTEKAQAHLKIAAQGMSDENKEDAELLAEEEDEEEDVIEIIDEEDLSWKGQQELAENKSDNNPSNDTTENLETRDAEEDDDAEEDEDEENADADAEKNANAEANTDADGNPIANDQANAQAKKPEDEDSFFKEPVPGLDKKDAAKLEEAFETAKKPFVKESIKEIEKAKKLADNYVAELKKKKNEEAISDAHDKLKKQLNKAEAMREAMGNSDHDSMEMMEEAANEKQKDARKTAKELAKNLGELAAYHKDQLDQMEKEDKTEDKAAELKDALTDHQLAENKRDKAIDAIKDSANSLVAEKEKVTPQIQAKLDAFEKETVNPEAKLNELIQSAAADKELAPKLKKLAEKMKEVDKAADLKGKKEEIKKTADALAADLQKRQGNAAMELAKEDVDKLKAQLALNKIDEAAELADEIKDDIEKSQIAKEPVAMNDEAFDASSEADKLDNQDAINKAKQGDYEAAAKSMEAQAEKLSDPEKKAKAKEVANEFENAADARNEDLSPALQNTIKKAEKLIKKNPLSHKSKELNDSLTAAKNQEFEKAANFLEQAQKNASPQQKAIANELKNQLKNAIREERKKEKDLDETDEIVLAKIEDLEDNLGTETQAQEHIARAELKKAKDALKDRDYEEAAKHMDVAAQTMDNEEEAKELATELKDKDEKLYADMGEKARSALQESKNPMLKGLLEAAKDDEFQKASTFEKNPLAAKSFREAVAEKKKLQSPEVQAALKDLQKALQQDNTQTDLKDAMNDLKDNNITDAYEKMQKKLDDHKEELAIMDDIEEAKEYQEDELNALKKAEAEVAQNKFNQAAETLKDTQAGNELAEKARQTEAALDKGIEESL